MNEQRTEKWFKDRLGKVTASKIADVMARTKSGWGASRKNYMAQLVAERVSGQQQDSYSNAAMQWGIDNEQKAIECYEAAKLCHVEAVGFIEHPTIEMSGASPDGLVGDDGLVETKCPNTATHIETLLSGKIADKYIKQMQWQMSCTGTQWCDFVSYDPRVGADLCLWIKRVERDQALIDEIEQAVIDFNNEIEQQVSALENLKETQHD